MGVDIYTTATGEEGNIYRDGNMEKGRTMGWGSNVDKEDIYIINMDEGSDNLGLKRSLEKGREESDVMAANTRDESPKFG